MTTPEPTPTPAASSAPASESVSRRSSTATPESRPTQAAAAAAGSAPTRSSAVAGGPAPAAVASSAGAPLVGLAGRRTIRFALAFILGAKLALVLLAHGEGRALASGTAGTGAANGAGAAKTTSAEDLRNGLGAVRPDVRALLEALEHRQTELDAREREVTSREERLALYEKDVTAKVASLEEIEKRLSARAKAATQAVDAAAESLAKIYGAMKPESAAPILDRLDDPTVLTIFRRMKEKQVGEILPLMTRDRAIALTQALADRQP